ncbi:hypothetical protein [Arthrobacter bambusae]|uniref:hypothetical protein n=1 Tax=Arthrobacter bambusae TaxID=1338426 RepID=UPI0027827E50|nr:hypothetical protein [Arthrobacter bambusae]MDQ0241452.1 hypothetical protein [Arthrobacter bambusae]
MPFVKTISARVRTTHLLVRTAEEWDALSFELFRVYDGKDDELIEKLREPFLAAWRAVTRNLLAGTLESAGIKVSAPAHPWGVATLEWDVLRCEPLLCSVDEELPDALEEAAVYGGLRLQTFDEVMAAYEDCLVQLLRPNLDRHVASP